MWQPEPSWRPLRGGTSSTGLWLAVQHGREVVVKRLSAPVPGDPDGLLVPWGPGWWRREADVALAGVVARTPGLRSVPVLAVEEDDEGITLLQQRVPAEELPGLYVARSLGGFAAADLGGHRWLCRGLLRTRLGLVEHRGGWRTLARTGVADVADHLWRNRGRWLDELDALPQVPGHGDPVPGNLPGQDGGTLLGLDWSTLGTGPVGADLGYWSLSAREGLEPLLEAYLSGLPAGLATREQALLGARVTAAYTVLTRADWALARAAVGEGALAGKLRHPAVAPYLRSLQRLADQIEPLLA